MDCSVWHDDSVSFDPANPNLAALSWTPSSADIAAYQLQESEQGAFRERTSVTAQRVIFERFATDNGLDYRDRAVPPRYPGCIFINANRDDFVFDSFTTSTSPTVSFGNYHPDSEFGDSFSRDALEFSGAAPAGESWGYLAIQLERSLSNLLLQSRLTPPHSMKLPVHPDPTQVLGLEGDFNQYFTLYCQQDSREDAYYVLTPDLMALLVDQATPFDVEIAENWLFVYSPVGFDLLDPNLYSRLFGILRTIGAKVALLASRDEDALPPPSETPPAGPRHLAEPSPFS